MQNNNNRWLHTNAQNKSNKVLSYNSHTFTTELQYHSNYRDYHTFLTNATNWIRVCLVDYNRYCNIIVIPII